MDSYLGNPSDPLTLNLYTYCYNNPIMYIDPSGHDSYILYGQEHGEEGGFDKQAKSYKEKLESMFNETVHLYAINTEEEFASTWNSMGTNEEGDEVNINRVILFFHSNPHVLLINYEESEYVTTYENGSTNGTKDAGNNTFIGDLNKKDIVSLELNACNSAHLDYNDNLAISFLNQHNISFSSGWDGSMAYSKVFGMYIPRLALKQSHYYSWAKEETFLWHKYKDLPQGSITYRKDKDNNVIRHN